MLHAHPRARAKAPEDVVILEGDQDTPHGEVPENDKVNNARYAHDVKPVTFAHCLQCFGELHGAPLVYGNNRFFSVFLHYVIIDPVCREVNKNVNNMFETSRIFKISYIL